MASLWQGRRLARPIVALREASARIAGGDFNTPVDLKTGDELELLADDLNTMARRLNSFYQELEAQVAQRTGQLSEARDVAERASLAKTRFLAAAAHDLRQPMHTIGLLLGVLRSRLTLPEQQALAERLLVSVETMERLFGSLLDISKLDAGVVQPRFEPLAVQELLNRLRQQFELTAQERGLRLEFAPCSAWVRTDAGLLERCLGNLISNALRYTPAQPRGRVLVGARRRGDGLALQVLDTGIGIAPDKQAAVFEEFVRLPGAETSASGGLGLGLAIVRRTAELLHHPLRLVSVPGKGSCFEIQVPLWQAAVPASAGWVAADGAPDAEAMQGLFVLVVDDEPDNRNALEALCTGWGCLVATAADAGQALALLDEHLRAPDLLLTDLRLGAGLDGLELVATMRRKLEFALPALLITAETDGATAERAHVLEVPVVVKPATAERLAQATHQLLLASPQHLRH